MTVYKELFLEDSNTEEPIVIGSKEIKYIDVKDSFGETVALFDYFTLKNVRIDHFNGVFRLYPDWFCTHLVVEEDTHTIRGIRDHRFDEDPDLKGFIATADDSGKINLHKSKKD